MRRRKQVPDIKLLENKLRKKVKFINTKVRPELLFNNQEYTDERCFIYGRAIKTRPSIMPQKRLETGENH